MTTTELDRRRDGEQGELFPPADQPTHRRGTPSPRRRPAGLFLTAVIILVVGFLIGRVMAPATDTPTSAVEPIVVTVPAPPTPVDPGDIAAVAALVSPSVVQLESETGLGSGVIFDPSGLILTAAHVIDGADTIDVRLADGRLFEGTVVGTHAATDVGVVSIEGDGFPTAVLGYGTSARVGETAVALGSPFGFDQTVTAGIVSATGRNINGVPMVQTDAAINPGNSGGPLVNGAGHVIGINDVIFTQGGGNDGIGFAIAIDIAIVVAEQLVAGDDVQLSAFGVATIADTTGEGGAIVREVVRGSAADRAGIEVGDRIVSVDGNPILDPGELFAEIITHRPGALVEITFLRDGQMHRITVELDGIER
ncbi:MAG: trypsin-like peptidase domain-containing protein [Acidimicrobiia bacterium]